MDEERSSGKNVDITLNHQLQPWCDR